MLKSMTGYGRGQLLTEEWDVLVEIRAVNHRYFEFSSKIPKAYIFLEDKIKSAVQKSVSRGKTEVNLSIYPVGKRDVEVQVNLEAAESYLNAMRVAAPILDLQDDMKLSDILKFSDVFTIKRAEVNEEAVWAVISEALQKALAAFASMREVEGEKLKADLLGRLDTIASILAKIEERSPELKQEYFTKLYRRLTDLMEDKKIDEARLLTEAAVFADKTAVDEETVRLHSHLHQFADMLEIGEPIGRKLDFLVQEMNRETNTIGSKIQDIEVTAMVVDIKAEIEKIREQIQNIE